MKIPKILLLQLYYVKCGNNNYAHEWLRWRVYNNYTDVDVRGFTGEDSYKDGR